MSSVDKKIADEILETLAGDSIIDDIDAVPLTIPEQIRFIRNNINALPIPDRRNIVQVIVVAKYKMLLVDSPEGITVNMDRLPNFVINEMYKMLMDKLTQK